MAETAFSSAAGCNYEPGCEKEAVCIDAYRVYDSCGEEHCASYKNEGLKATSSSNCAGAQPFSL